MAQLRSGSTMGGKLLETKEGAQEKATQAKDEAIAASAPIDHVGASGTSAHPNATTSSSGFMSSSDKTKLNSIASGAEVNQNAFSSVRAGSSTLNATGKTDQLILQAGPNINITGSSKTVTISADKDGGDAATVEGHSADEFVLRSGSTMTGHLTLHADPVNPMHAVNKEYVDAIAQGIDVRASVRVATTGNISLSGTQTIDGVAVKAGDRVLVKDQTSAAANGIYVVASGSWSRSDDANDNKKVNPGMYCFVEEGTQNQNSGWILGTSGSITLGTTALDFIQFTGAGQINAGAGLSKSGNTLSISNTGVSAGTYKSVTVNARGQITAGTNPTTLSGYGITDATPSSHIGSGGSAHSVATTSSHGFMSSSDKSKLNGIATGAEVNQNAFTSMKVGSTTINSGSKTDTFEFIGGTGITASGNATNKTLTLSVSMSDSVHGSRSGGNLHSVATTSSHGFMSSSDKSKLDGIDSGAQVNQNAFSRLAIAGQTTATASSVTDTLTLVNGSGIVMTTSGKNVTIGVNMSDSVHGNRGGGALHATATTSTHGFMSSTDKAKLNGIATGAEVNQNAFTTLKVGSTNISAGTKTDTVEFVGGSNITLSPDASGKKITINANRDGGDAATVSGYRINQNLRTTDDVTFRSITTNYGALIGSGDSTNTTFHGLTIRNENYTATNASTELRILNTNTDNAKGRGMTFRVTRVSNGAEARVQLGTGASSDATNDVLFLSGVNNRVGIGGVTSPAHTLDVGGNINASQIYVNGTRKDNVWDAKVSTSRSISAGTGLTGGGNFSANRTISFDTAWGDARYLQLTGGTLSGQLTIEQSGYDPLVLVRTNTTQHVEIEFRNNNGKIYAGAILETGNRQFGIGTTEVLSSAKFKVDAPTGEVTVDGNQVWHAGSFNPDSKVSTGRTITAGTGLTGGGSLTSNRTINFDTAWGDSRYLTTTGGSVSGRLELTSDTHMNHLRMSRSGVGTWDFTPTNIASWDSLVALTPENSSGMTRGHRFYLGVKNGKPTIELGDGSSNGDGAYTVYHTGNLSPLTDDGNTSMKGQLTFDPIGTAGEERIYMDLWGAHANDVDNENGGAFIRFRTSTSDGYGAWIGGVRRAGGSSDLVIKTGAQNPNETVRVLANGNMGIGTSSPSERLEVSGSGRFSSRVILGAQATSTTHAVRADRTITAGTGLTGGGNLTSNRTIHFDEAYGDARYLSTNDMSEQTVSGSEYRVKSTSSDERFSIEFNESEGSLDFVYYAN